MRVLYDISTLGLAHLYPQSRGGAFRADLNIADGLAASGACELLFCANHSTVAHHGCEAFLRGHHRLAAVPLVTRRTSAIQSSMRALTTAAHGAVRRLVGRNALPSAIRRIGGVVDRRLHPPVGDAMSAIDIVHCSTSTRLPAPAGRGAPQRFLTVHDLSPVRFPEIYGSGYRGHFAGALQSLRPGDHVITNSNFIRDEIAAGGIASGDRIHVVPLAADPALFHRCEDPQRMAAVRVKYGIPDGPYVLAVTNPDLRKNVPRAVHAFARAAQDARDALSSLVLVGSAGPGSNQIAQAIAAHPALQRHIVLTGHVPDGDLSPLYSGAQLFVYPSLYEGFGLPPLEAMQCGTAVITSNTSALPEVVGDGGVMVAPDDVEGFAGAMLDLARDSDRRRALQQRALTQARRFSWELSTAATLRAYRAALVRR
jgi:glycosyltransferase involved in cell wall biosynthesis